ncbi:MAG: peptidase E [Saprospiraceae bacterium]
MKRQIIALGGGGFSMEPDNPLLDDYILKQTGKTKPKVCFIGTASGDAEGYILRFYEAFQKKDCTPSHLSLFQGHTDQIEAFILAQDLLYVGGGNTRNLIVLWKEWGLDRMIRKAYESGTVLAGISAGSICWFEQGLTDSIPNQLNTLNCLGFLKGSNCPHFDGEPARQSSYKSKILAGEMLGGIACDDSVGLHFVDETLMTIISSRPDAAAYRITEAQGQLKEALIKPTYLGND